MTTRSCGGLTNPRGRYPFRVPRLEPSRPGQGQGLPHVSLAYVLRMCWGGAEAALAGEAGRAARSAARSPCINVSLGIAPAVTAATVAAIIKAVVVVVVVLVAAGVVLFL